MRAIIRLALFACALFTLPASGQEQWLQLASPTTENINVIRATGADTAYLAGNEGVLYKTTNGGSTWTQLISGVSASLYALYFTDASTGYAVGLNGTILKTTNAGVSWVPKTSGTSQTLYAVNFVDSQVGFAAGASGVLLRTINAGDTWNPIPTGTTRDLNSVHFIDSSTGWITSNNQTLIFKTTDGGSTWQDQSAGFSSVMNIVQMIDANLGYVLEGHGMLAKTTNGGATWTHEAFGTGGGHFSMYFLDGQNGYAGGRDKFYRTTNGGNSWTSMSHGSDIISLHFAHPLIGYGASTQNVFKHVHILPAIPAPSLPAQNAVDAALSTNLAWSVVPHTATYRVQVATDAGFSSLVLDDSTLLSATTFLENLSTSTTYYWRVNAKNPGGTSDWSTVRSFTTVPPIPPIPNLSAPVSGAVNTSVTPTLEWAASAGAVTYRLQVSSNPGFTALIKDTVQATTSKTLGLLPNNTTHYWRVSATNAGGTSDWSTVSTFTTIPIPAPPVLSSPGQGAINTALSLNLEWSASAGAVTYRVQLSTDQTFATTVVNDSTVTGTSRSVGPLANNTTYYWRVNAKNGGTSAYSSVLSFTTLPAAPAVPALTAPAAAAINVPLSSNLTWGAVSGAASYHVQLSTDANFATTTVNDSTVTVATLAVGPLIPGTTYHWRVNAKNAGGTSAFSTTRSFTTVPAIPSAPGLSSPVAGATGVPVSTSLNWVATAGAVTYRVQLSQDSLFASTVLDDSTVTATTRAISSLLNNTSYFWRVNAKNPGGTSGWSETRKFTTTPVSVLALTSPAHNATGVAPSVALTWSAATGVTSYHVQFGADSLFASMVVNDSGLTAVTRNVGPLTAGTSYFWRVRAKAPGGTGDWTATWKFTVLTVPSAPVLSSPGPDSVNVPTAPNLVWQALGNAATYRVQLANDSLFASLVTDDSTLTATTRAISALSNAATYYWRVNAKNAAGTGPFSAHRKFTTTALGVPTLTAPAANATGIPVVTTLSWSAVGSATGYGVQVSTDSLFATLTVNSTAAATSLQVGPLSPGTAYYWRVRARNTGSDGAFSGFARFTTTVLPTVPALVSPAADTTHAPTTLAFTWTASTGAATYRLQVSTDSTFATAAFNDSTLTALTRTVGPLAENTTYYWRVNAKNTGGTSAWSSLRRFTTAPPTSLAWAQLAFRGPGITGGAMLRYRLPDQRRVQIRLHDARGAQVANLLDKDHAAGSHQLSLPEGIPQGLYLLDFRAGEYRQVLKLVR